MPTLTDMIDKMEKCREAGNKFVQDYGPVPDVVKAHATLLYQDLAKTIFEFAGEHRPCLKRSHGEKMGDVYAIALGRMLAELVPMIGEPECPATKTKTHEQ